ncbi:glycoside hydrolase family 13 protein [Luteipulveratus flavus]|uniref:Glycoside hydrolase family 13 protein n=1 Tax=Luteipulveratus flavus TaxID=3031728 RepID=A0ABT6CC49_9MICO|nr:glycoside hydrolase family 13 protein [Luteipulveratus sp. YIM 133296]MDF8266365.1 glycoside hydrolase family 13 protein [Luteipulveratus sp. YIM 133296]
MNRPHLLDRPHHDGSALYVSTSAPEPGERVRVRVRVPRAYDTQEVHVRQVTDGEPEFRSLRVVVQDDVESWWEGEVVCHNPVTSYRFILKGGPGGYAWLNGTGVHDRDVPDAADFRLTTYAPPPEWALDSVVYQVFPDRFARSSGRPPVADDAPDWAIPAPWDEPVLTDREYDGHQLYGGDLDGVREHLDHLERLGVTTLYLTPFFPGRSNHRYDAESFERVDPVLGGDEALRLLVREAHARGLRVMGDLTTNHTGVTHEWFVAAQADPEAPERDFYLYDESGDYVSWLGVKSLPKLNHQSGGLRERLFDADDSGVRRWLQGDDALDGWRVDVANMTGRWGAQDVNHQVARHMRKVVVDTRPDALLVGEHCHDHSQDAMGDGWHGVMNYSGFTRPVWTWLRDNDFAPKFLGSPLMVPRLGGDAVAATMDEFGAIVPWRSRAHSFTLVGSHDTTRVRTLVGEDPSYVVVAAGLLLTMPGIPMITYGDEIGMEGAFGEDGRRPMPWDESDWETDLFDAYRQLVAARRELVALRRGGLRWVHTDEDALVFLRETPEQTVLVLCARGPVRVGLPVDRLPGIERSRTVVGKPLQRNGAEATIDAPGPQVSVWAWDEQRGTP